MLNPDKNLYWKKKQYNLYMGDITRANTALNMAIQTITDCQYSYRLPRRLSRKCGKFAVLFLPFPK